MSGPHAGRFAEHVHEVVDLDAHGASYESIEARVDSMPVDREERSALWSLAFSLHTGARTARALAGAARDSIAPASGGTRPQGRSRRAPRLSR